MAARSRASRRAFTLVELLVVVAVIALLVAILVPSYQHGMASARQSVCLTNLRVIGTAAVSYAACNRMYIPRGNDCIWFKAFLPYLGRDVTASDYREVRVYRCPSFPSPQQCVCYVDSSWSFGGRWDMYGYEIMAPTRIERFTYPSEAIYLADNEDGWWRPVITDEACRDRDRLDVWTPSHLPMSDVEEITYGRRVARDRHRGGSNVMYVDGHAAWVKSETMTVDMWRDRWR